MSNNNNSNSKKIIHLKQSDELKQSGLVTNSVYYIDTHDIKISLNHNTCTDIIFTIDCKKWQNNLDIIVKMAEENGITEKKNILLLKKHLNYNYQEIFTESTTTTDNNNKDEKKQTFTVNKYSEMGNGPLHEAIIVNGLPFFVKYDHVTTNTFELVEKIEENSRILKPPQKEGCPYIPYEFVSNEELAFFMQKAREVTLDELFKFSFIIFSKYVDHDKHVIVLLAADAIWTYVQDLFPATHYGEGVGTNDVGKSSIGYTFEITGYRVVKATAISGANYYRLLGSIEPGQCVIIEDEGDNINEDTDKVKILKIGYEYNGRVPKINMNIANQDQNWFFAYCYKMILAEKSLKEYKVPGLVDRIFSFQCRPGKVKYSIKEVVSQNINKSPRLKKLYDKLLSFRKLMLCYRLIHYKDLLPDIETGLKNRDQELCKPLLQLFYGTESLEKEIIPTLELFVKQRRMRKANSLEAALYPIIKKYVFANAGLNYLENTYSELKEKKKTVKVPFYEIWDYIKEGGIDGNYDSNKKYQYETVDYGTLYRNSLPIFIRDRFTATRRNESYGISLIFDIEKLESFEDVYGDIQLNEDNVKIEVKLKTTESEEDDSSINGDFGDFGDFLGARPNNNIEKNQQQTKQQDNNNNNNNNNNTLSPNDDNVESNSNSNNNNNTHAFQKSQESQESQESPVINNNDNEDKKI